MVVADVDDKPNKSLIGKFVNVKVEKVDKFGFEGKIVL